MGEDLRFSSAEGKPLKYQIEQWDGANGLASIWVRVPLIQGNQRQLINLHWGNPNCESESDGKAVFNESNGYAAVMHMSEKMEDSTGFLTVKDQGTTDALGMIGSAISPFLIQFSQDNSINTWINPGVIGLVGTAFLIFLPETYGKPL